MCEKGLFRQKFTDSVVFAKLSRNPADTTKSVWVIRPRSMKLIALRHFEKLIEESIVTHLFSVETDD